MSDGEARLLVGRLPAKVLDVWRAMDDLLEAGEVAPTIRELSAAAVWSQAVCISSLDVLEAWGVVTKKPDTKRGVRLAVRFPR